MRFWVLLGYCVGVLSGWSGEPAPIRLTIASPAFAHGGSIPARHTCKGGDVSPPLTVANVPAGTRSLVLIVDDPDAPRQTWTHWLVYDLDPATASLPEASVAGVAGKNSWGNARWQGPCPPSGEHRYYFKLFALDTQLGLAAGASVAEVLAAAKGHILAKAVTMGRFQH